MSAPIVLANYDGERTSTNMLALGYFVGHVTIVMRTSSSTALGQLSDGVLQWRSLKIFYSSVHRKS